MLAGVVPAWAAPILQLNGGGYLIGATGVEVSGTLYDVEFIDGSCIGLFSGCDEASDFAFTTQAAALVAAQVLLDTVFVGFFDETPYATVTCEPYIFPCDAYIPYARTGTSAEIVEAHNT